MEGDIAEHRRCLCVRDQQLDISYAPLSFRAGRGSSEWFSRSSSARKSSWQHRACFAAFVCPRALGPRLAWARNASCGGLAQSAELLVNGAVDSLPGGSCGVSGGCFWPPQPNGLAAGTYTLQLELWTGTPINEVGYLELIRAVSDPHHAKKAILLITTYVGSAESGYKIARWFQRFYEEFWLYPTSVCASAGTLVAMGANGLYVSSFSELDPLDVQLAKRNELGEYKSGLVTKAA
jgi:hypothetical protein